MAWIFLLLAGLFEIVWAFLMKMSEGFTKPWATVGTIGFMIVSFGLLSLAMKGISATPAPETAPKARTAGKKRADMKNCKKVSYVNRATPGFGGASKRSTSAR